VTRDRGELVSEMGGITNPVELVKSQQSDLVCNEVTYGGMPM
jgi:hypothetical protein